MGNEDCRKNEYYDHEGHELKKHRLSTVSQCVGYLVSGTFQSFPVEDVATSS